jgi:flagellar motor switch protein FliM
MTFQQRAQDLLLVERLCTAARRRGGGSAGAQGAAEWDWTRPRCFTARQRGRLQAVADRAAGRVAAELAGVLRTKAEVEASPVAERYAASLRGDETPAFWVELREASGGPAARRPAGLVRFPAALAGEWVDRLLGGAPRGPDPARRLSAMETALLAHIGGAVGGALAAACQECGGPALRPGEQVLAALPSDLLVADDEVCEFALHRAGAGADNGPLSDICLKTNKKGGSHLFSGPPGQSQADSITVFLRSDLLGPVADPASAARPSQRPEDARAAVLGHFENASVTVTAGLGTADVKVRDLVSLAPGDVVVLRSGPQDLVTVTVDGVGIVRGRPARCAGRYAVLVEQFQRHPRVRLDVEPRPRKET